jgi:hypothetical protein
MQNVLNLLQDNNFDFFVDDEKIYSNTHRSLLEDSFSFEIQILDDDELSVTKTHHLKHDDNLYFGYSLCHIDTKIIPVSDLIAYLNVLQFENDEYYVDEFNFHLTYR